jgi:hypothetical protein
MFYLRPIWCGVNELIMVKKNGFFYLFVLIISSTLGDPYPFMDHVYLSVTELNEIYPSLRQWFVTLKKKK